MLRSVRLAKRAIDVAGAAVGLALTAPLMPLIAAAIYIDSPGPVLFRQRRAGSLKSVKNENGKKQLQFDEFEMHKFRTMVPERRGQDRRRGRGRQRSRGSPGSASSSASRGSTSCRSSGTCCAAR